MFPDHRFVAINVGLLSDARIPQRGKRVLEVLHNQIGFVLRYQRSTMREPQQHKLTGVQPIIKMQPKHTAACEEVPFENVSKLLCRRRLYSLMASLPRVAVDMPHETRCTRGSNNCSIYRCSWSCPSLLIWANKSQRNQCLWSRVKFDCFSAAAIASSCCLSRVADSVGTGRGMIREDGDDPTLAYLLAQ